MPARLPAAAAIPLEAGAEASRGESEQFPPQALRSFAEAADSLEPSYGMLRSEVARLHGELERSNAGLARSLEENRQMRHDLDGILDGLPCDVLGARAGGAISRANPEARRLPGAEGAKQCRLELFAGLRTLAAAVNHVWRFHGLPAPERVATDLGQLLDWAGGFLLPMARQARVELCLRNHLQGAWFAADRHRLEQVLLSLALNALRAMPGGGWVEISGHTIPDGDRATAVISVSDTGPGVSRGEVAKIFEPRFSHAGSPGLSLAVCRKIVEQHGGSLAARNRAGAGASFTLKLPLPKPLSQEAARKNPQPGPETGGEREHCFDRTSLVPRATPPTKGPASFLYRAGQLRNI